MLLFQDRFTISGIFCVIQKSNNNPTTTLWKWTCHCRMILAWLYDQHPDILLTLALRSMSSFWASVMRTSAPTPVCFSQCAWPHGIKSWTLGSISSCARPSWGSYSWSLIDAVAHDPSGCTAGGVEPCRGQSRSAHLSSADQSLWLQMGALCTRAAPSLLSSGETGYEKTWTLRLTWPVIHQWLFRPPRSFTPWVTHGYFVPCKTDSKPSIAQNYHSAIW